MLDLTCHYHVQSGDGTRPCGRPAVKAADWYFHGKWLHVGWCAEHIALNQDAANNEGPYFAKVRDV